MGKRIKKLFEDFLGMNAYKDAELINKEGNVAFKLNDEDLLLQTLLTNTCTDVFYATKEELLAESFEVHKKMLAKDPKFYAQTVIYARNKGFMRLQPILGTVFLSTLNEKSYFRASFPRVILTPSDLESFLDLCRTKSVREGIGRSVKTEIIKYLQNNISEYYAMKYKSALRDAIRLSRPNAKVFDGPKRDIIEYIMKDEVITNLKQIKSIEELKKLNTDRDEKEIIELIEKGRVPYEAVVGAISPTRKIWEALLYQMPIMATLRHINVMIRNGVFNRKFIINSEKSIRYVCEKLQHVEGSKILPFRYLTALESLEKSAPERIKDALRDALDKSFVNMPKLKGRTCIAPDVSGSMWSYSPKFSIRPISIAAIFSSALLKSSEDCIVLPADTQLHEHTCSRRDTIMTNAQKLMKLGGGGTELDLPMEYLTKNKIEVDNYICLTDSEEWYTENRETGTTRRGFYKALLDYKRKINKDVKVFFIRIMPYRDSTLPMHEPNLYNIEGWSNTVIEFIATISNFGEDQVKAVRKIEI